MSRLPRRHTTAALALLCATVMSTSLVSTTAGAAPTAKRSVGDLLKSLTVAAEPASQSWERFGQLAKSRKAGCRSVRDEVLANDAEGTFPKKCNYANLTWVDPYSGKKVSFRDITFDWAIPQLEAWQSGASAWDGPTRLAFLNDLGYDGTLLAVAKKPMAQRNEREPQRWLPKAKATRCSYVANWIAVKYRWGLTVDSAEKTALANALKACGTVKIAVPAKAKITRPPAPTPAPAPTPSPTPSTDPRKDTCAELKAANLGPYVRGIDAEYAWYRDDDGDGVACESPEAITISPSNDWQTERYTRSSTPRFAAVVTRQPDPAGSGNTRGVLHARLLSGEAELWRGANDSPVVIEGRSEELIYTGPLLADGAYVLQIWSSYSYDPGEAPPLAATALSFLVDTLGPEAPTYVGSSISGTAISYDPELVGIVFTYADSPHAVRARPGEPAMWQATNASYPYFDLRVQAYDRAGNLGTPVTRSG